MRSKLASSFVLVAVCVASPAVAQVELPRPSPFAKMVQTVGLTDITIDYSSPAVRGRKIWGGLVPYGEVWRTGANAATKVTFSKDVTVGAIAVPAGAYAFFAIPNKTSWTLILNKEANQGGAFGYKKEQDLLRLDVKPQPIAHRERLAYLVSDFTNSVASIDLEWEKVRVSLPIKLATDVQAAANIKTMTDNAWAPYNAAARYLFEQKKDYDGGLALAEKSIAVKEDWLNVWTKAQLLAAKGDYKAAYPLAQRAEELGAKAERFFFADEVKKALVEWKAKAKP